MPTIFSHPAVPILLGVALGTRIIPMRLIVAGVAASILPDLDVISFKFGVDYADQFGHRGASHSLVFAVITGVIALLAAKRLHASKLAAFSFIFIATISHGLLDMLTTGGLGVALAWPIWSERLFFPLQVIRVSPLSLSTFFGTRGITVLTSELIWIWLPLSLMALTALLVRRSRSRP